MCRTMFITNNFGEYIERDVFSGASLSGIDTVLPEREVNNDSFIGYGVAITGSSCYNLMKMEPTERHELLTRLYGKDGLHFGIGRLTIGASDYSPELYTYDDTFGDTELKDFSIDRDRKYVIPIIKEILDIAPDIKLFASPWSPPGWMKTGGSIGGGYMREKYIETYAEYFVKYIQAYAAEGINIYAVTVQNETQTSQDGRMPACIWHPDIEARFICTLRDKFDACGIATEIWCHDHNFSDVGNVDWYMQEYSELRQKCSGIAFHYYSGCIEQTAFLKEKYSSLKLHFTEGGPRLYDNYSTDWCKWGLMLIKALNNGYSSFTGWNLMLDETGGPDVGPFYCAGLVTRNSQDGSLSYSGQYKAFRHFECITADSVIHPLRITPHSICMSQFPTAEALRPDGCLVENPDGNNFLILVNPTEQKSQLQYNINGESLYIELLPKTLATIEL